MLDASQRAYLRGLANGIQPILHIGKQGVTDNIKVQADEALEARELVKGTVLKNADVTAEEALDTLCKALRAEPVQAIGRRFVLYRESKKNKGKSLK
jgi:RNA-binding protein